MMQQNISRPIDCEAVVVACIVGKVECVEKSSSFALMLKKLLPINAGLISF